MKPSNSDHEQIKQVRSACQDDICEESFPRVVDHRVLRQVTHGRKVAYFMVRANAHCAGVWHRHSDFERMSFSLHLSKPDFPRSLNAWHRVQGSLKLWRCTKSSYLKKKAERLTDFLQELEEEIQQKENSNVQREISSRRDSIDSCWSDTNSSDTNSTRYDDSSDGDSSESEDVTDMEVELGSCVDCQIGKSQSYTQLYHNFCGIELNEP